MSDAFFFGQYPNPINLQEIKFPCSIGMPQFRTVDGVERIHRTINTKTIMDWWKELGQDTPKSDFGGLISDEVWSIVQASCADIKAECIRFDASYMKALGYAKLWFVDLTPGDTSIGYEMWGEK